jgi:RNA polymerase sigma factor (sigma-70 family)
MEINNLEKRFKKEIEPYRSLLWKYCYRLTGSPWDAEDLVQDTLLKSLALLSKVFQELNVKSYLFKIATNIWIDQQRKNRIAYSDSYPVEILESGSEKQLEILPVLDYLARQLSPKQFVCLLLTLPMLVWNSVKEKQKEILSRIGQVWFPGMKESKLPLPCYGAGRSFCSLLLNPVKSCCRTFTLLNWKMIK